jgi:RimJ/RimL family protein N-acetyltransferase
MKPGVQIHPARPEDGEFLFALRNEPSVIAAGDSGLTAGDGWLDASIKVIWAPIGYLRFDRVSQDKTEVSIALVPDMRGRGFGTDALTHIVHPGLTARVKRDNNPSLRAFRKAGFVESAGSDAHVHFEAPK